MRKKIFFFFFFFFNYYCEYEVLYTGRVFVAVVLKNTNQIVGFLHLSKCLTVNFLCHCDSLREKEKKKEKRKKSASGENYNPGPDT